MTAMTQALPRPRRVNPVDSLRHVRTHDLAPDDAHAGRRAQDGEDGDAIRRDLGEDHLRVGLSRRFVIERSPTGLKGREKEFERLPDGAADVVNAQARERHV